MYTMTEKDDPTWLKLQDLFANMPDNVFYSIDLRAASKETANLVWAIVKAYGVERRLVWGSSTQETHDYLLELDPETARYYNAGAVISTLLWYMLGVLWLRRLPCDFFMAPVMTSEEVNRQKWVRESRGSWSAYFEAVLGYKMLQTVGLWMYPHLRRRNVRVVLWVANEVSEWGKIKNTWRVDGI